MRAREYANILMRKAGQDEFTVRKLIPDPASPDEVIGFHAQQAVEKMLKATLAYRSISYRRTHDLVELIDLIGQNGIPFPIDLEEERLASIFPSLDFQNDRFYVAAYTVGFKRRGKISNSEELKPWSLAEVHERLRQRYWPSESTGQNHS